MPRRPRIVLPERPHHIVQRGHNRQAIFASDDDYGYYLANLEERKTGLGCRVYAYCLMTNHVHLLVDPGKRVENLALLMKSLAGRQTRYINKLEGRRGTLWEGRYKSSPIKSDEYLLACCRYVELNPVRAGLVDDPGNYRWSSYRHKTGTDSIDWLYSDPHYRSLGPDGYREWVKGAIPSGEWDMIREAVQRGQLTGSGRFVEEVAEKIGRRVEFRGQGRPKKEKKESDLLFQYPPVTAPSLDLKREGE